MSQEWAITWLILIVECLVGYVLMQAGLPTGGQAMFGIALGQLLMVCLVYVI